jgi:hypothetical protein
MTMYMHVNNFNLASTGYTNNTVKVNMFTFKNIILPIANKVVTKKINNYFAQPKSIECPLKNKCLGKLYFSQMSSWADIAYTSPDVPSSAGFLYLGVTP